MFAGVEASVKLNDNLMLPKISPIWSLKLFTNNPGLAKITTARSNSTSSLITQFKQMTVDATIFHIAANADITKYHEHGVYQCASLKSEGFIHCCDKHQLAGVVQRYYLNVDNVQLMLLDPDKLDSPLIRENTVGGSEHFPHVYGPIKKDAVKALVPFGLSSTERTGVLS